MREAKAQYKVLALHLSAVSDADDFKDFLKTVADAVHHVADKGSRHAVRGADRLVVVRARHMKLPIFDRYSDVVHYIHLKAAFGSLDKNMLSVDLDLYAFRKSYRFASYSRHLRAPPLPDVADYFAAESEFTGRGVGHESG